MARPAGKSDASHSGAGSDTAPAGRRGAPAPANSVDTAGRRRGGSRAARAGRRTGSSTNPPDRRRGRERTPADTRGERSARTGASPRALAGDPQGCGHARGLVRVMGCGKGRIASPRCGPRARRGPASGPSPSRRPGGNRSTLPKPVKATGFGPPYRLPSRIPHFPEINDRWAYLLVVTTVGHRRWLASPPSSPGGEPASRPSGATGWSWGWAFRWFRG